jgi:hypothetical protein
MTFLSEHTSMLHILNAVLLFFLLKHTARASKLRRRPNLRAAVFSIVVLLDLCFLFFFQCSISAFIVIVAVGCISSLTFPEELTSALSQSFGSLRFHIYISSVFTLAALVCLYLPITTFLTSPGEIGIHLEYLLSTNLQIVMAAVYLAAGFYAFALSPRMKSILAFTSVISVTLALIYAYIYPFGYPIMNGLMFEQIPISTAALALRTLVDLATIITVVTVLRFALSKFGGRWILTGILITNIALPVASGVLVLKDTTAPKEKSDRPSSSNYQPIRFSKDENNVLILFLDRFMGGFVEKILKDDPKLAKRLDGFVWYPRTVAAGENSIAGVHPLLGGYDYTPTEMNKRKLPLRDVSAESYAILPYNFIKKGYEANFVNPRGLGFTMEGDCSFLEMKGLSCSHIPASVSKKLAAKWGISLKTLAKSSYADLLVLLSSMRTTPYIVRAILREKGPWRPFLDHSAGTTFKEWAELKSLSTLTRTDSNKSNLNIVFNTLPHEPYFVGEDCTPRTSRLTYPKKNIKTRGFTSLFGLQHYVGAKCALQLVSKYLGWMKKAGVYDSTKIVIVSDHGIRGSVDDTSSRAVSGDTTGSFFVRSRSTLFVKERNAHGSLRISEEFLPNAEVPRIVCEEIGGCVNPYLDNRTIAAHGRDDPFLVSFVPWQFNLQEKDHFKILELFSLKGRDPYNAKNWGEL